MKLFKFIALGLKQGWLKPNELHKCNMAYVISKFEEARDKLIMDVTELNAPEFIEALAQDDKVLISSFFAMMITNHNVSIENQKMLLDLREETANDYRYFLKLYLMLAEGSLPTA